MPETQRIPTWDNIARTKSDSIRSASGHRIVDLLRATSGEVCHAPGREFYACGRCKCRARPAQ